MKQSWWEEAIVVLILVPLKILELALNCFAFICMAIAWPVIQIIKAIKHDSK